ncbi:MAG: helix-turn-helix transcriptional regulator [Candidatus Pacebacteria bacterium]|nr:helix-turn-helix transcriptional regulator [Candidatus Paceibacterota bacterium]
MKLNNTSTKLNYFFKSISSRKRIEIIILLSENKNISLKDISKKINTNIQNTSLHTFKLLNAGLIAKKQNGLKVEHILTGRGEMVANFIKTIDKNL